jgi:hypothetical protein
VGDRDSSFVRICAFQNEQALRMTTSKGPTFLFFTPYGEWGVHNQLDVTVAAALQARDCQIHFVTCDGLYQPCAISREAQDCTRCQKMMAETLSPYSFCTSSLASLIMLKDAWRAEAWVADLSDNELPRATFDGLPIAEWVLSTAMTRFRISDVKQISHAQIVPIFRSFIRDTLLTYWAIDRLLEHVNFDALFLFNGRYYPYRAAFEAARRRGIRILVHERGRTGNSFSFFEEETCLGVETARRLTKAWSEVALDESEIKKLEAHFSELFIGRHSDWPSFYDAVQDFDPRAILDIPNNARLIGLFTTSSDEIAHLERFGESKKQFELIETVAQAIEGTNIYLVVRHHPHMAGSAYNTVEVTGFDEAYRQALSRHKNVRIIMPRDDFTSYALFPYLTAAIAPFSSIAMELIAFGIPTLVSNTSDADFDERFVLTDWSQKGVNDAVRFIVSPKGHLSAQDLRRFYRKCFSVLFRFSVEFRVIGIQDYFQPVSKFDTMDALLPGHDQALDRICNHLVIASSAYLQPDARDNSRPSAVEDRFINRELDVFAKRREARETKASQKKAEPAPISYFAVLMDETIEGHVTSKYWHVLPHAQKLSIQAFSEGWFTGALLRQKNAQPSNDFAAWSRRVERLLDKTKEDYVLVSNARFQFHDTSIAVISEAVKSAISAQQPVIALSGWIRDPDQFAPIRLQPVKTDLGYWRNMRERLSGALRPQDTLSSAVVRRDWLTKRLRECEPADQPADALEDALFNAAIGCTEEISVTQPVFLLR